MSTTSDTTVSLAEQILDSPILLCHQPDVRRWRQELLAAASQGDSTRCKTWPYRVATTILSIKSAQSWQLAYTASPPSGLSQQPDLWVNELTSLG